MQNKNSYVLFKTFINSPRQYDNIPNYSNTSNIVYKNNSILHFAPIKSPIKGEQIIETRSNNSSLRSSEATFGVRSGPNSYTNKPVPEFTPASFQLLRSEKLRFSIKSEEEFRKSLLRDGRSQQQMIESTFGDRCSLNYSNYDNKKTKMNKNRVKFDPVFNKIIIIHGLSFYNENTIKKDIWWTVAELNTMRNLLRAEVNRVRMINPQRTIQQCIREICTK